MLEFGVTIRVRVVSVSDVVRRFCFAFGVWFAF